MQKLGVVDVHRSTVISIEFSLKSVGGWVASFNIYVCVYITPAPLQKKPDYRPFFALPCRMIGSLLNETLVGTFPPPVITQDGITIDRFLAYSVR